MNQNSPKRASDELVSEMAQELLKGATLTDMTCPECSTPLLRNKTGDTYCPKCKRPVIIVDEPPSTPQPIPPSAPQIPPQPNQTTLGHLQQVLQNKVTELTDLLAQTTDPTTAKQILETIDKLLEVYQKSLHIQ